MLSITRSIDPVKTFLRSTPTTIYVQTSVTVDTFPICASEDAAYFYGFRWPRDRAKPLKIFGLPRWRWVWYDWQIYRFWNLNGTLLRRPHRYYTSIPLCVRERNGGIAVNSITFAKAIIIDRFFRRHYEGTVGITIVK